MAAERSKVSQEGGRRRGNLKYYPIAVRLERKSVLVVGGGAVAERKVKALLEAGGRVTVVSPGLSAGLKALYGKKRINWRKHPVRESDLRDARLVIAAASDERVNRDVSRWAAKRNILANVVDRPDLGNFITPAVFKKGKAIAAVYTDGRDPVLSRDLKNYIRENWDEFISYRNRL